MQSTLESREDFSSNVKNNPIELLKAIKEHTLNYREHQCEMSIIADAWTTKLLHQE